MKASVKSVHIRLLSIPLVSPDAHHECKRHSFLVCVNIQTGNPLRVALIN